ncbi:GNAT family N-acetyltransferase [Stagnihabitans tardus]|uniref:GNAT family N-acetyltransferase n=1 Tax=Stagnihabitans tardus TaxID=2699202 RepID=A0AAE4YF70_9RHOB|nr:GNAT family N-acetyltransferase [Stagnihabitans tardus]NBZ89084.1 GNAT family N-acetyltransferase [Stagnihabitans tardus]
MIRDATPADEAAWRGLWAGYLAFYDHPLPESQVAFTWTRLMDPESPVAVRLACEGDRVLGFAIHLHHPSTWVMGEDCYLEDLFVAPEARGKGLGRALIEDLKAIGRAKGWHRIYWHTEATNTQARALYDQLSEYDGHIRYRTAL